MSSRYCSLLSPLVAHLFNLRHWPRTCDKPGEKYLWLKSKGPRCVSAHLYSYPNEETLEYGIDNHVLRTFLIMDLLYIWYHTVGPISLNRCRDEPRKGWVVYKPPKGLWPKSERVKIFKEAGYDNYSIMPNDYMVRGYADPSIHDYYFPNPSDETYD